jgi:hypothetical protein
MLEFGVCSPESNGEGFEYKVKVEKFNVKNNFTLWKLKMHNILVQQGLHKALICVGFSTLLLRILWSYLTVID